LEEVVAYFVLYYFKLPGNTEVNYENLGKNSELITSDSRAFASNPIYIKVFLSLRYFDAIMQNTRAFLYVVLVLLSNILVPFFTLYW
jgi:hypothetical protein